jgi:hypothetical protein
MEEAEPDGFPQPETNAMASISLLITALQACSCFLVVATGEGFVRAELDWPADWEWRRERGWSGISFHFWQSSSPLR